MKTDKKEKRDSMSEWDCPLERKWTEPVKEQAIFYLSKAYMQGYDDALAEMEKETNNVQSQSI